MYGKDGSSKAGYDSMATRPINPGVSKPLETIKEEQEHGVVQNQLTTDPGSESHPTQRHVEAQQIFERETAGVLGH